MRDIILITAMDYNNAIGKENKLLCKLKDDMHMFRVATEHNIVVMGRKTFESIGKPLPKRINIVLTRDKNYKPKDVIVAHSVEDVLEWTTTAKVMGDIFVIGGAEVYEQFLPQATALFISRIEAFFEGADAFFPQINWDDWEPIEGSGLHFEHDNRNEYPFTHYAYMR